MTTTTTTPDRIEKQTVLKAPLARVWRALSNAQEFATWFGIELDDDFAPDKAMRGTVQYQGKTLPFRFHIEKMEPERLLSFRWHPYGIDPDHDYSQEPMTLVELAIAAVPEGTRLTITESGFAAIPAERRAKAFEMNGGGWAIQLDNIARHVHA
jgi:uncharacterized protein YndB with AHSA1/START domain